MKLVYSKLWGDKRNILSVQRFWPLEPHQIMCDHQESRLHIVSQTSLESLLLCLQMKVSFIWEIPINYQHSFGEMI
jgi:hypothetical protein